MNSYKRRTYRRQRHWKMGGSLGLAIIVATVLYLGQVNVIATSGMVKRARAFELERLITHNRELEIAARDLETLPNLAAVGERLRFVSTNHVEYAAVEEMKAVARR